MNTEPQSHGTFCLQPNVSWREKTSTEAEAISGDSNWRRTAANEQFDRAAWVASLAIVNCHWRSLVTSTPAAAPASDNHTARCIQTTQMRIGIQWFFWTHALQCESKKSPTPACGFLTLFSKRLGILNQFLRTYYMILYTLDYKFLFNYF